MNRLISISFLLLLVTVQFRQYVPFLAYAVNLNYITKNVCVNRDKPKMHCNGKCYLRAELNKAAEEEKEQKLPPKPNSELKELLYVSIESEGFLHQYSLFASIGNRLSSNSYFSVSIEIDTPPPRS